MDDCRHRSSVGIPASGEVIYPEQNGLKGAQVRCTDDCGRVFASIEDLYAACRNAASGEIREEPECLDRHGSDGCTGAVEYRHPLSGSGKSFPRCDGHWEKRLAKQEGINRRYAPFSNVPPAGLDPSYAGESWDETY